METITNDTNLQCHNTIQSHESTYGGKVPLEYAMATFKKAELYFNWQSNPLCASEYYQL